MDAFIVQKNRMGLTAVRLHYSADPEKNPDHPDEATAAKARAWYDAQKQQYLSEADRERELEINWDVAQGVRVFPTFNALYHVGPQVWLPRKVVYRSWDFGFRCPVVLYAQIDRAQRLILLREQVGTNLDLSLFAPEVVRMSGEMFPNSAAGFEDFCDPSGQMVRSLGSDKDEHREIEVLQGLGVHPSYEYGWSRKDGRALVHRLLQRRTDGVPGLLVDTDGCPLLIQAFLGRYVYPETRDGKVKDEPDDLEHPWADLMAALRYLVTGLHGRLGLIKVAGKEPERRRPQASWTGYGTPKKL